MKTKSISAEVRKQVLQRDDYTCQKCGFHDPNAEDLEIHHINPKVSDGLNNFENLITLCSICHSHAPDLEEEFRKYINEKIDSKVLDTFRKSQYSIAKKIKQGMINKLNEGKHLTKAPKGYKIINKELIIDQKEAEKVREIFKEFLDKDISLTKLAKEHGMTTAGIKKLLQNTTYVGKVKFVNQESKGNHKSLIDKEIFDKVQAKLKQISYATAFKKNTALLGKILIQGDGRYYDYYAEKELAHFLTNKAVIIEKKEFPEIKEPTSKDLDGIRDPQKIAKYIALTLLKERGFSDSNIFFERNFEGSIPDVAALSKEKEIFVECFSCRISKVIEYLAENRELWILTTGSWPWDENFSDKDKQSMEWFIFKKGPSWDNVYQEYERKIKEMIRKIKNPLDVLMKEKEENENKEEK